MADGMWTMREDGSFALLEPYKTMLAEAKVAATTAWHGGLIEYLEPRCPYSAQELSDNLVKRNRERPESAMEKFEEFVLEALAGDL